MFLNIFFACKAERVKNEKLDVICVPSSFQSKQLLIKHNLKQTDLETETNVRKRTRWDELLRPRVFKIWFSFCFKIDVTIDGADEVDKDLICIKGGGACHLQEKLIAYCAKKFVIIADIRKKSNKLGQSWRRGIPIEVFPSAYRLVQQKIEQMYGGKANLRENESNPTGTNLKAVSHLLNQKSAAIRLK